MLGILYLTGAFCIGLAVSSQLGRHIKIIRKEPNNAWMYFAMSVGIGYLLAGWMSYLVAYASKVIFHLPHPMLIGNIAVALAAGCSVCFLMQKRKQLKKNIYIKDKKEFKKESVLFGLLLMLLWVSMFYVFHMKDGYLCSGATVFSDYSPHTAMIRSFSKHNNFPTQYPHFGGTDVKYHFMFQFLVGNLETLGMRIDYAFNLISIFSLFGFLVLLYYFAKSLAGRMLAGVLTILMFFCRSSLAVFEKLMDVMSGNMSFHDFWTNTSFIGSTAHEDWGLWNYNVYLNQRHLGFGLLIGMIAILYYVSRLDFLDGGKCKDAWIGKEAWNISEWKMAAAVGLLLGSAAFWNGAVVIGVLLILFGFALFSKHKLDYLITAGMTILLSVLQTVFFTDSGEGQAVGFSFQFGFLAEQKTAEGVIVYLFSLSGILLMGVIFMLFWLKGKKRVMLVSFLLPGIFAFTVSMTPDIAVNHKYVMMSTVFLNILWAYILTRLFEFRGLVFPKIMAMLLTFMLTATGWYDLLTIYNANKAMIQIDSKANITKWLEENLSEKDLVLTGEYAMSEVTLSGIMMYNGWPYYAWSAGYDTDDRAEKATAIYTSYQKEEVRKLVKNEGIDYIIYEDGMTYEGMECHEETIESLYPCVYTTGAYRVYRTQN